MHCPKGRAGSNPARGTRRTKALRRRIKLRIMRGTFPPMARTPAVELAKQWLDHAEGSDAEGMTSLLADDAVFYASQIRGRRFSGRHQIEAFLRDSGFEATGYSY